MCLPSDCPQPSPPLNISSMHSSARSSPGCAAQNAISVRRYMSCSAPSARLLLVKVGRSGMGQSDTPDGSGTHTARFVSFHLLPSHDSRNSPKDLSVLQRGAASRISTEHQHVSTRRRDSRNIVSVSVELPHGYPNLPNQHRGCDGGARKSQPSKYC